MKKFFIILIFNIILLVNTTTYAMTPTFPNDAKFSRGVSKTCYYVDSNCSQYTSQINSAINNWVDTGFGWNPIYVTPVASNYATHIDFYAYYSINHNVLDRGNYAYTSFWDINEGVITNDPDAVPDRDYFYTEITINEDFEYSHSLRVITHEIGHAFGLNHTKNKNSIMYVPIQSGIYDKVQKEDHDTINYLYN